MSNSRYEEATKVTLISIIWNVILTFIKVLGGILGKSNAMIADGLHSASDIISSIGVLIGNKIAKTPNDKEHNYGHEKAETLVSFLLSMLLIGVALKISLNGINSLIHLNDVQVPTFLPLIISVISIGIKEYQYKITIKVAKKINSPSLKADAWHHRSDALSSVAAFIGIGGSLLGFKALDPIATVVVGLFVAKVGLDIFKDAINELMDYSINENDESQIITIANDTDGVLNIGELRTRKHGSMAYVDLTICVNKDLTVLQGHEIANKLEISILEKLQIVKGITVHVEPCINCDDYKCCI
ncbi:MAG: cation diffusion facilitator family transporter [Terrisporobacter othiniensis]|uniref:cation diffusion facilitator family transporter n=1 Tax=Terrisporobacter petrolearius TaxID=1460447 RepID=UPI0022E39727|nr:cation diffusion facilitator family transporter [Terrisporobacter petrolearius]MDU4862933.1 cation diffusion facilitator family transporter [Terrisporobacter othiniensis]MDU6996893.1 cation diffusion facilitator family transporter [Terrisporobacter othiniensis]